MNINSDTLKNNKAIIIVGMFVLLAIVTWVTPVSEDADQEKEELVEEKHPAPQNEKNHYVRRVSNLPKHKRRMMPCNKKNSE